MKRGAVFGALLAATATAAPSTGEAYGEPIRRDTSTKSAKVASNGCTYAVPGLGSFTEAIDLDFTKLKSIPSSLTVSTNTIAAGTAPFARRFMLSNVAVNKAGYITLTVPGNQQADPILSAEIQTAAKDVLYGSIRTVAMASSVAGTTHGFSFYSNDTQEADIAFLTYDNAYLHLTNEQTSYSSPVTSYSIGAPSDATSAWHEYRMDWIPGKTMFYVDGKLVYQINSNVPSTPGFLLWNNWSNGNAWAKGPPQNTNVVKIQSITAYYNRTSVAPNSKSPACQKASAQWVGQTQSCTSLSAVTRSHNDANGVPYTLSCGSQLVNGRDLGSKPQSSFAACISSCDKVKDCGGITWNGGNGAGVCAYRNVTGAGSISNSDFDVAFLTSASNNGTLS